MSLSKKVVDFDQHGAEYAGNWRHIADDLRENSPVAWSEAHGGFWILSRYDDLIAATKDWETFSSENDISGTGNGGKGVFIPRNPNRFDLTESDPPRHTGLRKIEQHHFEYKSVVLWESVAKRNAEEALDAVIERGTIEFVHDICLPVPAKTVMELAGIPLEDWKIFALSAHDTLHLPYTHPDYPHDKIAYVQKLIFELVRKRRVEPREDIVSSIVKGTLNGEFLSDPTCAAMLSAIVFGGFDTAATSIVNGLVFMNDKPELRAALLANPKKMDNAIEEWLRLTPPSHALGRTVMKDIEIRGQQLKAGDRVLFLWSAANRDPRVFTNPDEFWLERPNAAKHLSFSNGPHRCLGSLLGKMEVRVTLMSILERIGDYRIDPGAIERFALMGRIAGYKSVRAEFTARPAQLNS